VSISGFSGIATKTSFAMFLLHSIIGCGVLKGEAHNTKALIFSVKSEDLLFLDYANSRLTPPQREQHTALGLPAEPFERARQDGQPRRLSLARRQMDVLAGAMLREDTAHFTHIYRVLLHAARAEGIDQDSLPDFLGLEDGEEFALLG
jgi:hypothetical protein